MMKQDHLAADRIIGLKNGTVSGAEAFETLTHIGECRQCAQKYAESFAEDALLELPPGFTSSVLSRIEGEKRIMAERALTAAGDSTQIHPGRRTRSGAKWELYGFSFRVGIAACITLFMLFSGTIDYGLGLSRSIPTDLHGFRVITENLRGFTDRLIDFDITKYIKEV